jgi:hypothetical protein
LVGLIVVGNNYSSEVQRCFLVGGALGSGMEDMVFDYYLIIVFNVYIMHKPTGRFPALKK